MSVFVIDANTVVSAALTPFGVPRRAIAAARRLGVIALSDPVYCEIAEVLGRPKLARVLSPDARRDVLQLLSASAVWFAPTEKVRDCRDSKDNRYLELALAARATAIISGDSDLHVLDPWRGVRVLRPAQFVEVMSQ